MHDHDALATAFTRFSEVEATGQSPLYAALSSIVAAQPTLLGLAAESRDGQPVPNLFFAAVHYVLEAHATDPLAAYYLSLGGTQEADGHLAASFVAFCTLHGDEIAALLRTRLVQTNEVRRSACLLPALRLASNDADGASLAMVEIGPSAGLNLIFERYAYEYGGGLVGGFDRSTVRIDCDARGTLLPEDVTLPAVASQIGLDINPLDVSDDRDVRWLRALTWPEHEDRRTLLDAAVNVARKDPPLVIGADLFVALPGILAMVPEPVVPCVVATHVLNQFTVEMRAKLRAVLETSARTRRIYVVVMGFSEFAAGRHAPPIGDTEVWLMRFGPGGVSSRLVADCTPHGRWLEFRRDAEWIPAP